MADKLQTIRDYFEKINRIPRCSKHEARIARWLSDWGRGRGFEVRQDAAGNLAMRVPATAGGASGPGIVIQGHMDMVCERKTDSTHDFSEDPIEMVQEGDWLQARETTLGADNGIALALALALAEDADIPKPELELLFTVDEETGLTGANQMQAGFVKGKILLNIDSEEEGVFIIGCAGGNETRLKLPISRETISPSGQALELIVGGLKGGHSGVDIHKQRANANRLLGRALHRLSGRSEIRLVSVSGGTVHNAIAREARAVFYVPDDVLFETMQTQVSAFEEILREEYRSVDPDIYVKLIRQDATDTAQALTADQSRNLIRWILAIPHGVVRMADTDPKLVETSTNLASLKTGTDWVEVITSQRSSSMSRLEEITAGIDAIAGLAGARIERYNEYPAWQPDPDAALLKRAAQVYEGLFKKRPHISVIHAGLECGIIGAKNAGMQMISFGPTIENAHSPAERLHLPSVATTWKLLSALVSSIHEQGL